MSPRLNCKKEQGFGLPMAIFIITVMAFLALAIHKLSEDSAQVTGINTLSMRAFFAAESGANIALNRLFPPVGASSACAASMINALAFPTAVVGLNQCTVTVNCTLNSGVYLLESIGQCGTGLEQATRIIEVVAQ